MQFALTSGGMPSRSRLTIFSASRRLSFFVCMSSRTRIVERLQLEQQEQPLEERDVELLAQIEFLPAAAVVALARGAAIVQQHLLEDVEVDLQVEAVGGFSRQDLLDVIVVDADVVRLVEDARHALDHARLHDGALVRREGARHQQVAVGAERLVGLLELVQLRVVLLAAPVIEVAEEAARLFALSRRPGRRRRQAVEQRKAGDRDEALLAACALGHHGVEGGDLLFRWCRGGGASRHPGEDTCRCGGRRCLHVGRRHVRAPLWRATQGVKYHPRARPRLQPHAEAFLGWKCLDCRDLPVAAGTFATPCGAALGRRLPSR